MRARLVITAFKPPRWYCRISLEKLRATQFRDFLVCPTFLHRIPDNRLALILPVHSPHHIHARRVASTSRSKFTDRYIFREKQRQRSDWQAKLLENCGRGDDVRAFTCRQLFHERDGFSFSFSLSPQNYRREPTYAINEHICVIILSAPSSFHTHTHCYFRE